MSDPESLGRMAQHFEALEPHRPRRRSSRTLIFVAAGALLALALLAAMIRSNT